MVAQVQPAERLKAVPFSAIRRVMAEADRLEQGGASIIHLEVGRPDFDTPAHIKEAAKAALDRGEVHYGPNLGTRGLRQAIARKLSVDNGLTYDPESEIMVTVGAAEAVFAGMSAFLNPGDEVLVPSLSWVNYISTPALLSAVTVPYHLRQEAGFQAEAAAVEAAITPRTRMLVLLSPGNPTGAVIPPQSMAEIARVVEKHNLVVLSDEIYEKLIYGDSRHISIASFPGMKERTMLINGFSKAYSMTGWRLGYIATARENMPSLLKLHQNVVTCAVTFAQIGAQAALEGTQDVVEIMRAEFERRRDMLVAALNSMPGVTCPMPGGAFYVFPSVKAFGISSEAMALYLLQEAGVATVPGTGFGPAGEGYIRISYANSYENIEEGMRRMSAALARLPLKVAQPAGA